MHQKAACVDNHRFHRRLRCTAARPRHHCQPLGARAFAVATSTSRRSYRHLLSADAKKEKEKKKIVFH
jgi:hypothetical protein